MTEQQILDIARKYGKHTQVDKVGGIVFSYKDLIKFVKEVRDEVIT